MARYTLYINSAYMTQNVKNVTAFCLLENDAFNDWYLFLLYIPLHTVAEREEGGGYICG